MSLRTLTLSLSLLMAASLILVGCSSDPDGGVLASDTGQLTIEIHDHPTPEIAECWITIDAMHARRQHGEWMPVAGNYPHHFDLMQLQGGLTRVLGSASVPAENYDHIRLRLTSAHLVMADGEEVDVPLPDGGLQIPVPMGRRCEVTRGSEAHVSMDSASRPPSGTTRTRAGPANRTSSWTASGSMATTDITTRPVRNRGRTTSR